MAALHMISYAPGTGTASGAELQSGVAKAAFSFSAEQVDPIFTAGDQDTLLTLGVKYNVNITQLEAYPQFWESYRSAYNEEGQKLRFLQTPDVAAGEMFAESFGAFAMVYRDTKGSSVIAYRGTYSTGDFANIAFGEATWFSDRLRWGMQQTWDFFKDRHGAWGEEEEKRESYLKVGSSCFSYCSYYSY
ncbi:hypothetical protein T492DRAFT_527730 [Pavlovales sp. CCMP2436]|nr:hypothetical protein T492DRAFT_527730 [Pavlovales sp. CCMP2436]